MKATGIVRRIDTLYEAGQKQAELEAHIRNIKNKTLADDALDDKENLQKHQIMLARYRQEYSRYCNASGLQTRSARLQVAGFSRSEATRATAAARTSQIKSSMRAQLSALTDAERNQLTRYTGFDATSINSAIQHGRINAATREKISLLDSALAKGTIPKDITVYRETALSFLDIGGGVHPTRGNIEDCVGKTVQNPIFTSTSFRQLGLQARDTVIELKAPAGHQGALYIRDLAVPKYKDQDEILFARGLKYKILSVDTSGNKIYIKAEVIEP